MHLIAMRFNDIILKKRNGEILSNEEIGFSVSGFVNGDIPDYQFAAFLMAVFFKGLNQEETLALTKAMINSGEVIDLSKISGVKVDKHSTGGVGDKTSLILGPLIAATGIKVAKLSGRGLGHTGGTIDKLESITGFSVDMTQEQFIKNVNEIGIAIGGQTNNLVPADKKIYALRNATSTVENISLIASSIMSKKLASGADCIVLDVKVGDGAFMSTAKDAFQLAQEMVNIGEGMGKKTVAVITDMNQPLGNAIGNSIEIKEVIDTLKGKGPTDLYDLCIVLGTHMLLTAGAFKTEKEAVALLGKCIQSGAAFEKFKEFIKVQGGNVKQVEDPSLLPFSKYDVTILAPKEGFINSISAKKIGSLSSALGAGRETKESTIDHGAGIYLLKKVGDFVKLNEPIAKLFSNDSVQLKSATTGILSAYQIASTKPTGNPLIYGTVTANGIKYEEVE